MKPKKNKKICIAEPLHSALVNAMSIVLLDLVGFVFDTHRTVQREALENKDDPRKVKPNPPR